VHNEESHNLYASPNIITVIEARWIRQTGQVTHMEKMGNAYTYLVRKPDRKRRRRRWKDNINMDLRYIRRCN